MSELVFFLEEPSAKAMLEGLLPRILQQDNAIRYVVFEGKQDLEKQLVRRMRGYRKPDACFIVVRDQDSGDCVAIKQRLAVLCVEAGRPDAIIRIACRELESFYLADLAAVEQGLSVTGLVRQQNHAKFRAPDRLGSPSQELKSLTKGLYQKIGGSRAIGPFLDPENSRSNSFKVLVEAIRHLATQGCGVGLTTP